MKGQQFNQSTGIARWNGLDGAAVLRLAGRLGIWDNRNVEPVRYWHEVTKIEGNLPVAAAASRGVIYENNSQDTWTQSPGHKRLSLETFGHGGNYSTVFMNDPLTSTIIVRQGENNADWRVVSHHQWMRAGVDRNGAELRARHRLEQQLGRGRRRARRLAGRTPKMVVEPLQQAFFFPPPFCRMTSAAGPAGGQRHRLCTHALRRDDHRSHGGDQVNPREGEGSSVVDRVEFYKEGEARTAAHRGRDPGGRHQPGPVPAVVQRGYPRGVGRGQDLLRQLRRQVGAGRQQGSSLLFAAGASAADVMDAGRPAQPNVNAKTSTPGSRNSISNCRSAMGFGCRIS